MTRPTVWGNFTHSLNADLDDDGVPGGRERVEERGVHLRDRPERERVLQPRRRPGRRLEQRHQPAGDPLLGGVRPTGVHPGSSYRPSPVRTLTRIGGANWR